MATAPMMRSPPRYWKGVSTTCSTKKETTAAVMGSNAAAMPASVGLILSSPLKYSRKAKRVPKSTTKATSTSSSNDPPAATGTEYPERGREPAGIATALPKRSPHVVTVVDPYVLRSDLDAIV